ncbi:hypothetical protein [Bacillus fonticola]|uniref:hypothetical protein n=1 Tax=Bacillus fonticola TaxID=2728853 RepID=UPI0014734FBD|nr:hypothetical protein [Bacillus fonticola]
MWKSIGIVVTLFFVAGCNNTAQDSVYTEHNDTNGTQLMGTGKQGEDVYTRDLTDDPRLNTNQNPNFLDLDEERPDRGTDQEKAEGVIERAGYIPDAVFIDGNTMRVKANYAGNMSKEKVNEAHDNLYEALVMALPRYDIRLKLTEQP